MLKGTLNGQQGLAASSFSKADSKCMSIQQSAEVLARVVNPPNTYLQLVARRASVCTYYDLQGIRSSSLTLSSFIKLLGFKVAGNSKAMMPFPSTQLLRMVA